MSRSNIGGPKLPSALLDRIGSEANGQSKHGRGKPPGRKEQRRAFRVEKKQKQRASFRTHAALPDISNRHAARQEIISQNRGEATSEKIRTVKAGPKDQKPRSKDQTNHGKRASGSSDLGHDRKTTGGLIPHAKKPRLDEDDAEIAALEKKLGLKGKRKASKSLEDGDFDELLAGLDDGEIEGESTSQKQREYDAYLASKRRRLDHPHDLLADSSDEDVVGASGTVLGSDSSDEQGSAEEGSASGSDDVFQGFDDDRGQSDSDGLDLMADDSADSEMGLHDDDEEPSEDMEEAPKKRENPYVPPIAAPVSTGKYMPPSLRQGSENDAEAMMRLRRQIQGLLNKLSEANLISIMRDFEALYSSNARQHITATLIDFLSAIINDPSSLNDTFIVLHAAFSAAAYKVFGAHFGAQLLERLVSDFDSLYSDPTHSASASKATANLMVFLSGLYNFHLVGSRLLFDYIRLFLTELSELNTELLLKIIRNCGTQLRHDDPLALKEIVITLQKSLARIGESKLPVRTKFMIETIDDLKNNRQKAGAAAASSVVTERVAQLKKTLGTLNTRAKANEPLGIGLADINASKKEGKWWLVGASWRNDTQAPTESSRQNYIDSAPLNENENVEQAGDGEFSGEPDLLALAKAQRMNNPVRRLIFTTLLSSSDVLDAHTRLLKLRLKKAQEQEIARVLIHCAGAEHVYNPFYTLIARKLCREHRFKWSMQYGLWGLFRRLGEREGDAGDGDEDGADGEEVGLRTLVNLGRMYGTLLAEGDLNLTSLKVLSFARLQPNTVSFLEVILATALKRLAAKPTDAAVDDAARELAGPLTSFFSRARDAPHVVSGLQYFLAHHMDPADVASSSSEKKALTKSLKRAKLVLAQLASSLPASEQP